MATAPTGRVMAISPTTRGNLTVTASPTGISLTANPSIRMVKPEKNAPTGNLSAKTGKALSRRATVKESPMAISPMENASLTGPKNPTGTSLMARRSPTATARATAAKNPMETANPMGIRNPMEEAPTGTRSPTAKKGASKNPTEAQKAASKRATGQRKPTRKIRTIEGQIPSSSDFSSSSTACFFLITAPKP